MKLLLLKASMTPIPSSTFVTLKWPLSQHGKRRTQAITCPHKLRSMPIAITKMNITSSSSLKAEEVLINLSSIKRQRQFLTLNHLSIGWMKSCALLEQQRVLRITSQLSLAEQVQSTQSKPQSLPPLTISITFQQQVMLQQVAASVISNSRSRS